MKNFFISIFLSVLFLPVFVFAADAKPGLNTAFSGDNLKSVSSNAGFDNNVKSVDPIISQIISIILSFLGVIFLVLTIYAGYLWMTAQGDTKKVEEAKDILQRAVIGLIVVVSAYAISSYVIENFAGLGLSDTSSGLTE